MTFLEGMRELIAHAATHPTVSPLETLFDVVARLPLDDESRGVLDALLYDTIRKHPAY